MHIKSIIGKITLYLIATFLLFGHAINLDAQERASKVWVVKTKDGNKYVGDISKRERKYIVMQTEALGEIRIEKDEIKNMEQVDQSQITDGTFLKVNSKTARYFFAPSALSLRKGEGYYQNTWVLLNQINYGITDNISLGLGLVPLFLFNGAPTPIWITPKISFPVSDNFSLGGGALVATIISGDNNFAGSAYGVATFGNENGNLSVGLGYGFANGVWADTPLLTLSGLLRTGKKSFLMTENYLIGLSGQLNTVTFLGGRTAWENVQLDYGFVTSLNSLGDGFAALPWLSLAVPFGKR
jgi:hypothetical protein